MPNEPHWDRKGAPSKAIDKDLARRAVAIGCTRNEVAALLGISPATLYNRLVADPEFKEELDISLGQCRATLRRMQWRRAQQGSDTMLIWLGKQLLEQKDRHEVGGDPENPVRYVIRGPTPVESADDWLKQYAPKTIEYTDVDTGK